LTLARDAHEISAGEVEAAIQAYHAVFEHVVTARSTGSAELEPDTGEETA
jgi:hypothetical protein